MRGAKEMRGKLSTVKKNMPDEIGRALYMETEVEATEVKKRTPVDKGALRASVHVVGPFREGRRVWTMVVAGGPSAPYAWFVHENPDAFHKVGQWKFIESVILESRPYMGARVAKRIDLNRAA